MAHENQGGWRLAVNWICTILTAAIFLSAGLWKASDPIGWAVRLTQFRVPQSLSLAGALGLGIAETTAGFLVLIPRFRRWGAWLGSALLLAFMIFIGIHYRELLGQDCSCFPWIKRAVGPQFFVGDGVMLALAVGAGLWSRPPRPARGAAIILAVVAVFALGSWRVAAGRHTGVRAPDSIVDEDGHAIPLTNGKILIYFFNPHCLHCLEAGQKLAAMNWGSTQFIGVPTESEKFGDWFMAQAGLKGKVSKENERLRKLFPFDLPPAAVALENGYETAMILQFEDREPGETLRKLGFVN